MFYVIVAVIKQHSSILAFNELKWFFVVILCLYSKEHVELNIMNKQNTQNV